MSARITVLSLLALLGACGTDENGVQLIDPPPAGTEPVIEPLPSGSEEVQVPEGPFPIVFAHGFFGFETLAGISAATYFYRVAEALADEGELEVYTPAIDPFNDSETRGEELLAQVERIASETGRSKVVIIGHSQGGLDARFVASRRPDLVAAVVTIAAPHRGSEVADIALGITPDGLASRAIDAVTRWFGEPLWDAIDGDTSLSRALAQLSTPEMSAFNARVLDAPNVVYWSFAGRSDHSSGGSICDIADAPDYVGRFETEDDPIDPALALTEAILDPAPNDGLVTVVSAEWGRFRGCIPADHMDQIGQLFGDAPGTSNPWRHRSFYRALVRDLRAAGF